VAGIGLVLVIVGAGLAATGLLQLRGLENIDHLVTVGVYARLRHPMYTGFVLWIAGWVLVFAAEATLVAAGIAIANILLWRQLEERQLQEQFGNAYLAYRDLTWF
jgi:protein-S-isoprenylcysteine O-methyltransferase Ste14